MTCHGTPEPRRSRVGLGFRDDDRKPFIMGRGWWLAPTVRGRYLSTVAKGWWVLGKTSITDYFEVEFAIGGEDNMAQAGVVVPFIGRVHVGVRVPRKFTDGWIYERREWTLRIGYVGRWAEVMFASDEHMRDCGMNSYYRRKLKDGTYDGLWSRAALWPGIHLTFSPNLKDKVLGRKVCTTTTGDPEPVVVPMPEGNYPATVTREDRVWRRKRWPFSEQRRTDYSIDVPAGVPVPGKGENSWDCDDDAIYGTGGDSPHAAVGNIVRSALRSREQYGSGASWVPDSGWPEGIAR